VSRNEIATGAEVRRRISASGAFDTEASLAHSTIPVEKAQGTRKKEEGRRKEGRREKADMLNP
jgi:hypothetical protein